MIFLYAFLYAGLTCLIGQIILDNTKLTPGHITTIFTILGVFLAFFNMNDLIVKYAGAGATILITNFGALLFEGAKLGYLNNGFLGLFKSMFLNASAILTATLVFSTILAIFFKPKN